MGALLFWECYFEREAHWILSETPWARQEKSVKLLWLTNIKPKENWLSSMLETTLSENFWDRNHCESLNCNGELQSRLQRNWRTQKLPHLANPNRKFYCKSAAQSRMGELVAAIISGFLQFLREPAAIFQTESLRLPTPVVSRVSWASAKIWKIDDPSLKNRMETQKRPESIGTLSRHRHPQRAIFCIKLSLPC